MSRLDLRRPRPIATRTSRVLLVEDDHEDAQLVRDMLDAGWGAEVEVVHVESLDAAFEHLADPSLTCVLLDMTLPGVGTLDALAQLRRLAPELPVVVLAAHADEMTPMLAIQAGAQDFLVKGRVDDSLMSRAMRYAIERKRSESQLLHQALHDSLTELPNRSAFLDEAGMAIDRARRAGRRVAVILLDLDRFAHINESLGHRAGDKLLSLVAVRLRGVTRVGDMVARFGGDEFTVLCEDIVIDEDAVELCERLSEAIAAPFAVEGTEVFLTASAGIAFADAEEAVPDTLVRDADAAMSRAKERGRAQHELFREVMRTSAIRRLETEHGLHRALERGQLRVHYQPTVALPGGRVVGVEALVRWQHPERGLVMPGEFIGMAEDMGLIVPIGQWVLDEACAQFARWREHGPLTMAVNLSARQLAQPDLAATVEATLARHAVAPGDLVLELTESLVVTDDARTRAAFAALRALGVRLAIDDFGTGYASLSALKHFPADVLKIDRGFVEGLGAGGIDDKIVAAVVGLARDLGLLLVAEGVETDEQAAALRGLGCELAQGYLFARPGPAAGIDALLAAAPRA